MIADLPSTILADWQPLGGHRIDWGNAGTWFGGLLSFVSILLVLYVILRDRRLAVRKQAASVSAMPRVEFADSPDEDGFHHHFAVEVYNASESAIMQPVLLGKPRTKKREREKFASKFAEGRREVDRLLPIFWTKQVTKDGDLMLISVHYGFNPAELFADDTLPHIAPREFALIRTGLVYEYECYDWALYFRDTSGQMWRRGLNENDRDLGAVDGYFK